MTLNLNGRIFHPVKNSDDGRVQEDALFVFRQEGSDFVATYSGNGVSDGHLIGRMTGTDEADLIYHSRAADGALEAGQAKARFRTSDDGPLMIDMNWQWLNGSKAKGTSLYKEVLNDDPSKA